MICNISTTAVNLPISNEDASRIASEVVRAPYKTAPETAIHRLFGADYTPGTFRLAERRGPCEFLLEEQDKGYEAWIRAVTRSHLQSLADADFLNRVTYSRIVNPIEDAVLRVLDVHLEGQESLCGSITNQEVTDIIWRIIKTLLTGNPYSEIHVFQEFNALGREYALGILRTRDYIAPHAEFKRSIKAGTLGLDVKTRYMGVGPSPLVGKALITLPPNRTNKSIANVCREIDFHISECFPIDFYGDFYHMVLTRTAPVSVVFFTDDYVESVFDLWTIQQWLLMNENIEIVVVPKHGRHANDASFTDIIGLLEERPFGNLKSLFGTRLHVISEGPASSGINAFNLSLQLVNALEAADAVLFKGARAYEMAQGLRKLTFFAFNVLRSYTESLTGLSAVEGPGVFIRQEPGIPSFDGFRARATRKKRLEDRCVGVARMTALEYIEAIRSWRYTHMISDSQDRINVNLAILRRAKELNLTFAEFVLCDSLDL